MVHNPTTLKVSLRVPAWIFSSTWPWCNPCQGFVKCSLEAGRAGTAKSPTVPVSIAWAAKLEPTTLRCLIGRDGCHNRASHDHQERQVVESNWSIFSSSFQTGWANRPAIASALLPQSPTVTNCWLSTNVWFGYAQYLSMTRSAAAVLSDKQVLAVQ